MKVSYRWLKDVLQLDASPGEVAQALTGAGFPVEDISPLTQGIEGVVVAELLEVNPHPNADRLSLTKVDDGTQIHDVVCGATNIAPGDKVPFAPVGTVLPGNFKIKQAKIRGQASAGMLCSAEELDLDIQGEDGILQLPRDSQVGSSLIECLDLDDFILDVELTANRGDLLSIRGLAAELAAVMGSSFSLPSPSQPDEQVGDFPIRLETEACSYYTGRLIKGVSVGPSPLWLQIRLLACGQRPVNNIVDITNLVMLEWGQPLHAFDVDKLTVQEIVVRQARVGEAIVTLDDRERKLTPDMMLITTGDQPVAVAGVMGSLDSQVGPETTNVLLESAEFDAVSVRKTAKALGIASEAGARYEKGVDPQVVDIASHRAAALMAEIAGGSIGDLNGAGEASVGSWTIDISMEQVNSLLGTDITQQEAIDILKNLGLGLEQGQGLIQVKADPRRRDLQVWQDIAEEIVRLHGLDKIPATLPEGKLTVGARTSEQQLEWQLREVLAGCGLHEVIPYSFIDPEARVKTSAPTGVTITNPLTSQRSEMRGSMLPSLLEVVGHNLAHGRQGVAIFELGNIYKDEPDSLPLQSLQVAGALAGSKPSQWQGSAGQYDFYDLKGVVEQLLATLKIDAQFRSAQPKPYHPGRCAAIYSGNILLGHLGQIHPDVQKAWKLPAEVYHFRLSFTALVKARPKDGEFNAPSKYPAILRDLAVETMGTMTAGEMEGIIREAAGPLLENVKLFDVYSGENLPSGRKSLAFSLSFRHGQRTLKDKEVQSLMDKIVLSVEQTGALLRS